MADALLFGIRWLHMIAAAAWVGGGIFYWVVVRPALKVPDANVLLVRFTGTEFGQIVSIALWVLIVTGAILAFDRLSQVVVDDAYVTVLLLKVLFVAWMVLVILRRRIQPVTGPGLGRLFSIRRALGSANMTVVLGVIVFLLSDVLRWLAEGR